MAQHDFDPLIGKWKFHMKRMPHPLTGSNTWVEMEGTGACYKILDGRAQMDTIELDGPTGHIEGPDAAHVRSSIAPVEALLGQQQER